MPCMLQGLFVQRVSSFQKYCATYVMKWVCAHVLNETMHTYMLETYFQETWLSAKECYLLQGILFLLKECHTLWMKVFVCKACSCQVELFLQEKDACLIVFCSHLQCSHCLLQVWGKERKLRLFHVGWITRPYWTEKLQRGGGTRRYINYT